MKQVAQCDNCESVILWRGFDAFVAKGWHFKRVNGDAVIDRFICKDCHDAKNCATF